MAGVRTKIDKQGRIIIPARERKQLGLKPGEAVVLSVEDGELRIRSIRESVRHAQAIIRQYIPEGRSLVDELIAERREEAERERDS